MPSSFTCSGGKCSWGISSWRVCLCNSLSRHTGLLSCRRTLSSRAFFSATAFAASKSSVTVLILVVPFAMEPDDFRSLIIDREKDRSKVFIGGSTQSVKEGKSCTEELVSRPVIMLACFRAVAGAFALTAEAGIRLVAHSA
jgi:hypothetical protein